MPTRPSPRSERLGTPKTPAIRFTRDLVFEASLVRICYGLSGCSPPWTDLTEFPRPPGAFTSRLPTGRSPFPSLDMTTTASGLLCWRDFHPQEWQLASLHQSLSVRPVRDEQGQETGTFEVPAGGRRFQALQILVKQKRLAKSAPVPCLVKTDGIAEEDSLAENTMREALHPLDQFRAFHTIRTQHGLGDEEIAARFFVTPAVVR